jgi:hypothetical protein
MKYIANYDEYTEIGGVLDTAAFDRLELRGCNIIDVATHQRIVADTEAFTAAKYAERDIIEYLTRKNDVQLASKSQTVGGISESESYVQKSNEQQQADIDDILYDYLGKFETENGVPILYRGAL